MIRVFMASAFLVLNYLHQNSIPPFRLEAAALFLSVWAPLALGRAVFSRIRLAPAFDALLIVAFLDLTVGLDRWVPNARLGLAVLAALWITLILLESRLKKIWNIFFGAALAMAVVFTVLSPVPLYRTQNFEVPAPASDLPNTFVIVLDEHMGLDAFPPDMPGMEPIRSEVTRRLTAEGFTVYTGVHSNYNNTFDSLPSVVSQRILESSHAGLAGRRVRTNRLFEHWANEGRKIFLYQSSHVNFDPVSRDGAYAGPAKIMTYPESSMGFLDAAPVPALAGWKALTHNFIENGRSVWIRRVYRKLLRVSPERAGGYMTGAAAATRVLDEVARDAEANPASTVFFVHLLTPHSNYIYDAEGGVNDPGSWEPPYGDPVDTSGHLNTIESRRRKYALYAGQVLHTHRQLTGFFDRLKKQGVYERSQIILFSDHGSRIQRTAMLEKFASQWTREDLRDAFSTLVAVKRSGETSDGEAVAEPLSLAEHVARFAGIPIEGAAADPFASVYVPSEQKGRWVGHAYEAD